MDCNDALISWLGLRPIKRRNSLGQQLFGHLELANSMVLSCPWQPMLYLPIGF
jgi:hypothetical protein